MSVALRFLQTCHGCYGGLGRPPGAAAWGGGLGPTLDPALKIEVEMISEIH